MKAELIQLYDAAHAHGYAHAKREFEDVPWVLSQVIHRLEADGDPIEIVKTLTEYRKEILKRIAP